jgi:hypothetical protein
MIPAAATQGPRGASQRSAIRVRAKDGFEPEFSARRLLFLAGTLTDKSERVREVVLMVR